MDNKNLPAYPQSIAVDQQGNIQCSWDKHTDFMGLTKLEMVSAMCLQGLLASVGKHEYSEYSQLAARATFAATALLNHLSTTEK